MLLQGHGDANDFPDVPCVRWSVRVCKAIKQHPKTASKLQHFRTISSFLVLRPYINQERIGHQTPHHLVQARVVGNFPHMARSRQFDIDQTLRDIDTATFEVHEPLQDDGEWVCTKTAWLGVPSTGTPTRDVLSPSEKNGSAEDDFAIILSPGEGAIVHHDLVRRIPTSLHQPITASAGEAEFPLPTVENPENTLNIIGETFVPFFMEDIMQLSWTRFNVKALVTMSELPFLAPSYSRQTRALIWIGVGEDKERSLFRLRHRASLDHPDSNHAHKPGYAATRDDGGAPDLI